MRMMKIPRMATVVLALAVLAGSSLVSAAFLGKRAEPFTPPDAALQAVSTGGAGGEPILVAPSPQAAAIISDSISTGETVTVSEQASVVIPPVLAIGTAVPALPADPDLSVSFASPQIDLVDADPLSEPRLAETDLSVPGLSFNLSSAKAMTSGLTGPEVVQLDSESSESKVKALGWWSENGYSPDTLMGAGSVAADTSSDDASAKKGSDRSDKAKGKSSRGSGKSKGKASGRSKGTPWASSASRSGGHGPKSNGPARASAKPQSHPRAQPKSSSNPRPEKKSRARSRGKGKR